MSDQTLDALAREAAELIAAAERLVVFTGAGVSTESGIPDFRSPGGIWSRFDPEDFTYQKFTTDPEARRKQWRMLGEGHLTTDAEPNPAHYAIAELYNLGKLDCVITQNVDNLHHKAGVPAEKVFELHGNVQWVVCLSCGQRYPFENIKARLEGGEEIPECEGCGGMLKPDAVLFGEALPQEVLQEASRRSSESDLFIVVGSTLVVYPAAYMPLYAVRAGAKLIIVNLSDTPMDAQATVLIRAKAGEAMSRIVEGVREKITG
ncbi:MAG TPA: Sir2 family NAD-dependent protein deacetylase [Dehalococcoidales bacterium]|nr:Sir2 family NAD-dependent protein deacetylase [Dehalococcoidales bacterium]